MHRLLKFVLYHLNRWLKMNSFSTALRIITVNRILQEKNAPKLFSTICLFLSHIFDESDYGKLMKNQMHFCFTTQLFLIVRLARINLMLSKRFFPFC